MCGSKGLMQGRLTMTRPTLCLLCYFRLRRRRVQPEVTLFRVLGELEFGQVDTLINYNVIFAFAGDGYHSLQHRPILAYQW